MCLFFLPGSFSKIKLVLICLCTIIFLRGEAQSYLKRNTFTQSNINQKIKRFSNGDVLMGFSAIQNDTREGTKALVLTRIDICGDLIWSRAYKKKDMQLEFCDFEINPHDEIFVFGSAIEGSGAVLFLMKVNQHGEKERFQFLQSETPSHSAFSINLRGNKILLGGSILEIGSPRTGFYALYDEKLNFQWANRITPFTFEGGSILDIKDEIIGRTGAFHYKLDDTGTLQWAKQFDFQLAPSPIGGPFEISDGYLFEAYFEDQAFFYKLDPEGQLCWKTDIFKSSSFPATIHEEPNGSLIIHYTALEQAHNLIHQLTISPTGEILNQKKLRSEFLFNVGSVFQSIQKNGVVNLVGNPDALTPNPVEKTDYLLQFSFQDEETECFRWDEIYDIKPNTYTLAFPAIEVTMAPLDLITTIQGDLSTDTIELPFYEVCGTTPEPEIIKIDTTLPCHIDWEVSLPSDDFVWQDDFPQSHRSLHDMGTYLAKNDNCSEVIIYEYHLARASCDCDLFIPNAFSPNGDGSNDCLQLFSNCQLMEIKTLIYDRWGNLIYQSQSPESLWDGTIHQKGAREGVYLMQVSYTLVSETGGIQTGTFSSDVTLAR